jgi:hypothetical protein
MLLMCSQQAGPVAINAVWAQALDGLMVGYYLRR